MISSNASTGTTRRYRSTRGLPTLRDGDQLIRAGSARCVPGADRVALTARGVRAGMPAVGPMLPYRGPAPLRRAAAQRVHPGPDALADPGDQRLRPGGQPAQPAPGALLALGGQ